MSKLLKSSVNKVFWYFYTPTHAEQLQLDVYLSIAYPTGGTQDGD